MIGIIPIATVKIVSTDFESGFLIINEADFNPEVHTLYDEASEETVNSEEGTDTPKRRRR